MDAGYWETNEHGFPKITPPGVSSKPLEGTADTESPHELRISAAVGLVDLARDYHLFSMAILYLHVPFQVDPWSQYCTERPSEATRISLQLSEPIFSGLDHIPSGDQMWNYVLYGLEHTYWDSFCGFLGSMAFVDRDQQLVSRVRTQEVLVPDVLAYGRRVVLPDFRLTVPVTVFCLETNQGCIYLQADSRSGPLPRPPRLTRSDQTWQDTQAFSKAILDEDPNPYRVTEDNDG